MQLLLLAFIALFAAQSSAQISIDNAILVIDTSNNASYNQVHWLVGTPYLSIKAINDHSYCIYYRIISESALHLFHRNSIK